MKQPTQEQVKALLQFADHAGRCWKHDLRDSWSNGHWCSGLPENCASYCQQVRNHPDLGPYWLARVTTSKIKAMLSDNT